MQHLIYEVQVYYTIIYKVTKFQTIMCQIEKFYRNDITLSKTNTKKRCLMNLIDSIFHPHF